MLEVSKDICALFNADRLTIYTISEDKSYIVSRVKTGLDSFQDLKLPITEQSIAGFAGLNKKIVNISKYVFSSDEISITAFLTSQIPGLKIPEKMAMGAFESTPVILASNSPIS